MKKRWILVPIAILSFAAFRIVRDHHEQMTNAYVIRRDVRVSPSPSLERKLAAQASKPKPQATASVISDNRKPASAQSAENWREWMPTLLNEKGYAGVKLSDPQVDSTPRWTRLTFKQTYLGHPVLPERAVTLLFDSQGKLETADWNLQAGLPAEETDSAPAGANAVLIVRRESSPIEVRWVVREAQASEWIAKDVQTGEIVWRKMNRHY